jgi:hypothetical protein
MVPWNRSQACREPFGLCNHDTSLSKGAMFFTKKNGSTNIGTKQSAAASFENG